MPNILSKRLREKKVYVCIGGRERKTGKEGGKDRGRSQHEENRL